MEAYEHLEQEFGRWTGVENVVACASGTAALHLALEALQLPPGSKVIVPDYTMIACARAVTLANLTPVFVDCGKDLLMDPDLVDGLLENDRLLKDFTEEDYEGVKAIMAVHVYGRRCNMEAIHELAGKYDLTVVEDMAEAHGVRPHPETDAACWSFYKNKIVAGEEGGAVAFKSTWHQTLAQSLRCLGFTAKHDFRHGPRGHNYRMSNAHARLIIDSLRQVTRNLERRRRQEAAYDSLCPSEWRMPPRDAPWVYDLRIPGLDSDRQDAIVAALNQQGVAARHGFKRMTCQEEYFVPGMGFTEAAKASREVIYLPLDNREINGHFGVEAFKTIRRELDRVAVGV